MKIICQELEFSIFGQECINATKQEIFTITAPDDNFGQSVVSYQNPVI